jgi:radical SAM protein with 4Fe4S-binding SPASM domain
MYDTVFFRDTFELKQAVVNRKFASADRKYISEALSSKITRKPFVFNVETTSVCNMKCVMCQRTTDMRRKPAHMELSTFQNVASQISPQDPRELALWNNFVNQHLREDNLPSENNFYFDTVSKSVTLHNFGEPLLDPFLPERVQALTERNVPSYFSCNPCNIKIDFIKSLFEAGIGVIKFALDSLDDQGAKEIRGPKADFTGSYEKILAVLDLKKQMRANTVIVLTMLDFYGDSGARGRFLDLWKGKDVYAYVKSIDNKWLLKRKGVETQAENKSHYKKQYCEYAWTSVTILQDGSVVPCTQDIHGTWIFGNVNEQSLEEIWNSEKYSYFRELQLSKDFPADFMCHAKCDLDILSYYYKDI